MYVTFLKKRRFEMSAIQRRFSMRALFVGGFLGGILAIAPGTVLAQGAAATPQAAVLKPTDAGWIARVQDALNAIHAIKARFQQIAPDGSRSTGQAWLDRPGKMRFDYDKPSPLLLIANDGKVVYQDRELGQVTTLPLDRTPLGLLLRPNLRLSGDVTVTAFQHDHGLVQVTLVRTATPSEGSLTLIFNDSPLTLKSWVVKDAQGRETQIDLFNVVSSSSNPATLFALPKDQD